MRYCWLIPLVLALSSCAKARKFLATPPPPPSFGSIGSTSFGISSCFSNGEDVIGEVRKNSPAGKAGVKKGDIVRSVHGIKLDSPRKILQELHETTAKLKGAVEMKIFKKESKEIVSIYSTITKKRAAFNLGYYGLVTWRESRLRLRNTMTKAAVVVTDVTVTPETSSSNTPEWKNAAKINTKKTFASFLRDRSSYCHAEVKIVEPADAAHTLSIRVARSSRVVDNQWKAVDVYSFELKENDSETVIVSESVSSED